MNEMLFEKYKIALESVSCDEEFVKGIILSARNDAHIGYMIDYIESGDKVSEENVTLENTHWLKEYKRQKCIASIVGLVVGDAIGVPVEFVNREMLKRNPVVGMRGYGTHNQPPGTWSDDSSMVIATMDWYVNSLKNIGFLNELEYSKLMDKFVSWMMRGEYTPYGEVFDIGIATSTALIRYEKGKKYSECGGNTEWDNGNGSLMRILPAAFINSDGLCEDISEDYVQYIYDISSLTHAHARSKLGCLIYSKLVADILLDDGRDKQSIVEDSFKYLKEYIENREKDIYIKGELECYGRLMDIDSFINIPENDIKSSGYVVDTLEAAVWCFLNTKSYQECVIKAVNLGDDTDTVAAVTGGLAGLYYGLEAIPKEWIECIPRYDWIVELAGEMIEYC